MLIRERLEREQFPDSQQAVVDYILANPMAIRNMSIRELAKATYTSNATMIRIAQKLDYPGWDRFKEEFIKEQDYLTLSFSDIDPNLPFSKEDNPASIAMKVAELKMEAISDTLNLVDHKQLLQAVEILERSSLINVLAVTNTRLLGELFALKLGRIHKLALASSPHGELFYDGRLERPDACTLVISYSGETRSLLKALDQVKAAGQPIIALTSLGDSRISRMADVVLRFCTREKMYSKISWYTTESGIEYLLDLLYSILFWKDYDRNLQLRTTTARRMEKDRLSSAAIMQEDEGSIG